MLYFTTQITKTYCTAMCKELNYFAKRTAETTQALNRAMPSVDIAIPICRQTPKMLLSSHYPLLSYHLQFPQLQLPTATITSSTQNTSSSARVTLIESSKQSVNQLQGQAMIEPGSDKMSQELQMLPPVKFIVRHQF